MKTSLEAGFPTVPPVVNASVPVQEVSPIAKNVSHSNPSRTEILSPHGTKLI